MKQFAAYASLTRRTATCTWSKAEDQSIDLSLSSSINAKGRSNSRILQRLEMFDRPLWVPGNLVDGIDEHGMSC